MPTKRCEICRKAKMIDERSVCCEQCEDTELDMLIAAYAFIHCNDSEFCPPSELIEGVEPINGMRITLLFLRSWVLKQWLETNFFDAVGVPHPVQEAIDEGGFQVSDAMRNTLTQQKNKKPKYDAEMLKNFTEGIKDDSKKKIGMVFMERKKGS